MSPRLSALLVAWIAGCDPLPCPPPSPERSVSPTVAETPRRPVTPAPYRPLADLPYERREHAVSVAGRSLDLVVWTLPGSPLSLDLPAATRRILQTLDRQDPGLDCHRITRLDVYVVRAQDMDDDRRFPIRRRQRLPELWGQYDPLASETDRAVVALRSVQPRLLERVLAHELAHHWHHRRCLSGSSEAYAEAFEGRFQPAVAGEAAPSPVASAPTVAARASRWGRRRARRVRRRASRR